MFKLFKLEEVSFKGEPTTFKIKSMIMSEISFGAFLTAVFLFGEYYFWIPFILEAMGTIFWIPIFRFISLFPVLTGFSLDDENKRIILRRGKRVPYQEVKSVIIVESEHSLIVNLYLKRRIRKGLILLSTGDKKEKEYLIEELNKRFSPVIIKKRSFKKITTIYALISILILGYFTFSLYRKYPQLKIFPEKVDWKINSPFWKGANHYSFNKISFLLPSEIILKETESRLGFISEDKNVVILISGGFFEGIVSRERSIFYLLGINDDYRFLRFILCSHLGVIPLISKGLYNTDVVKIYELKTPF
ncbi:MAG: hypothetical protein NC912_03160 [Candidatus Omnitrophica bacterium]|nr:hypothetical protein [Candidatus Omnitrophota bacterium]